MWSTDANDGRPELIVGTPLQDRASAPRGRVIAVPDSTTDPAIFEWELTAEEWSDEHPHDEYVFVLDGELHVTSNGSTVIAGRGALVRVLAGSRGTYAAPVHARVLSVYGPRTSGPSDARGVLRPL